MVKPALALVALAGCAATELDRPVATTLRGPAAGRPVHRILALPAGCVPLEVDGPGEAPSVDPACGSWSILGIDQVLRARLEALGYEVVDAARLNAVTASRETIFERREAPGRAAATSVRSVTVATTFIDAPPSVQVALMHELAIDALLTTRVAVAPADSFAGRRHVIVQYRLSSAIDHRTIWVRRCALELAGGEADAGAIGKAASCAASEVP